MQINGGRTSKPPTQLKQNFKHKYLLKGKQHYEIGPCFDMVTLILMGATQDGHTMMKISLIVYLVS